MLTELVQDAFDKQAISQIGTRMVINESSVLRRQCSEVSGSASHAFDLECEKIHRLSVGL